MKIFVHASERRYLSANVSVLNELKSRGHEVTLWLHMHDIPANIGTAEEYRKMRFPVIEGPEMLVYDGKDSIHYIGKLKPDVLLPVEPGIYSWIKAHKAFRSHFPKIPIISIQNSFGGLTEEAYRDIKREGGWYIDWHICWGSQQVARNSAYNFPRERMIITGNPAWDKYHGAQLEDHGYVLFIAGTGVDYLKPLKLERIYEDFPKLSWIFKEHPNHPRLFHNTCVLVGKPRTKILYDAPIQKLMRCAKVIINSTSTCGIDSMLLGKPVIILDIGENTKKFSTSGRMIKWTYEKFKEELRACLDGKEDRMGVPAFLESVAYRNDGLATRRVVETIERIGRGEGVSV